MKNIRAVIDTNIVISCLLKSPTNRSIYEAFKENKFQLVISERLLAEIGEVFTKTRLKIDPVLFQELITVIKLNAIMVKPATKIDICRDAKDNFIIEMAQEAKATHIVTRDKDILELRPSYKGISIVLPEEFLALL
jgi:putative PIN family toxin of toxin-antitoxin system